MQNSKYILQEMWKEIPSLFPWKSKMQLAGEMKDAESSPPPYLPSIKEHIDSLESFN